MRNTEPNPPHPQPTTTAQIPRRRLHIASFRKELAKRGVSKNASYRQIAEEIGVSKAVAFRMLTNPNHNLSAASIDAIRHYFHGVPESRLFRDVLPTPQRRAA